MEGAERRELPSASSLELYVLPNDGWLKHLTVPRIYGAEGSRTPDLCSAIAALSQLSYSPDQPGERFRSYTTVALRRNKPARTIRADSMPKASGPAHPVNRELCNPWNHMHLATVHCIRYHPAPRKVPPS